MIRTKGEPGTGDVVQAVRHMRMIQAEIRRIGRPVGRTSCWKAAKELQVPVRPGAVCARAEKAPGGQLRRRRRGDARPTQP